MGPGSSWYGQIGRRGSGRKLRRGHQDNILAGQVGSGSGTHGRSDTVLSRITPDILLSGTGLDSWTRPETWPLASMFMAIWCAAALATVVSGAATAPTGSSMAVLTVHRTPALYDSVRDRPDDLFHPLVRASPHGMPSSNSNDRPTGAPGSSAICMGCQHVRKRVSKRDLNPMALTCSVARLPILASR
jgi:hypothetical protein